MESIMAANVRFSNPKTMAKPPGYTYVVEATGPNRLIFIAGQLGLDLDNKLVGAAGDFRAQAEKAIDNLKLALADAGATIKDVVKINNYLVDMSHIGIFREVRDRAFNMAAPPASTTLAISQLGGRGHCSRSRRLRCCRRRRRARLQARRRSRKRRSGRRHQLPSVSAALKAASRNSSASARSSTERASTIPPTHNEAMASAFL